jgi:hypothetical protein
MKHPGEDTKKPHGNPPSNPPGYQLNDLERREVPGSPRFFARHGQLLRVAAREWQNAVAAA